MTANVDIVTGRAERVLVIPARAVVERGGKHFVTLVAKDGASAGDEAEVVTGLRDVSGVIEIRSGLKEGQKVVVSGTKK
jgi:multidrug efflux pump subunit AcrA (membrane-fusion protein)